VAPVSSPQSTVGAGDALLAGYLYATGSGSTAVDALRTGVAWGAAAVSCPGSRMPTPADVAGIQVSLTTDPDLTSLSQAELPSPRRNLACHSSPSSSLF